MTRHVVLVRHGETTWSKSGQHTSRTDLPLTDSGRQQAVLLGRALADRPFAQLLSSPLRRALDTCRLAGLGEPELLDDLREWDYGEYEGRTTADIRIERAGWTVWDGPLPGGESVDQFTARVDRVVSRLREPGDGTDGDDAVVVFSHGHLLRALAARWIDQPVTAGRYLALGTASISELGYERETPVIRRWNLTRDTDAP